MPPPLAQSPRFPKFQKRKAQVQSLRINIASSSYVLHLSSNPLMEKPPIDVKSLKGSFLEGVVPH